MKRMLLPLTLFILVFSSCNADPKKAASAVCDCIDPATEKLGSKAKKIMLKAFKSTDFQTSLQEELMAIEDTEERKKIGEDLKEAGELMQGKKMTDCLEEVNEKFKVQKSQAEKIEKEMVSAMEDECEMGAHIYKMGKQYSDKKTNTDEESTEEEDKTKKKKTTEEE